MQVKDCTLIRPLHCDEGISAVEAAKILKENRQRRIIVVDKNKHPIGIISTTDLNNRVVAENKEASRLNARDIMTSQIYLICDVNDELNDVFKKMLHHETYFCPATKDGKLYGILTYGEMMKHVNQMMKNGTG